MNDLPNDSMSATFNSTIPLSVKIYTSRRVRGGNILASLLILSSRAEGATRLVLHESIVHELETFNPASIEQTFRVMRYSWNGRP